MAEIFIEAESFKDLGGWVIDQQSMEHWDSFLRHAKQESYAHDSA